MRIANVDGRLKLLVSDGAVDVAKASSSSFGSDPQAAYERFDELREWAKTVTQPDEDFNPREAGPPAPSPGQVFAIALNYLDHAAESGFDVPKAPVVFTKYTSSFSGPMSEVVLPDGSVDWEVEVVAVIGSTARSIPAKHAWDHVAGLTVGQDLSERILQLSGPSAQFGLGKSYPGFSPMGPSLVTPEEFDRRDDIELGCEINGELMQKGQTSEMIFSIPEIVSYISRIVTLHPGDLIFTGTPAGVGMGRTPPRYLQDGDILRSWVDGIGQLEQRFVRHALASE